MTDVKMSPYIRNSQIFGLMLIHAGGSYPVSYFTAAKNVEAEIRAGTFGHTGLKDDEIIERVIMNVTSVMIRGGILECNTFNEARGQISYGADTTIVVAKQIDRVLKLEPIVPADPNEHHPYYGSDEIDAIVDRMGPISFFVLNSHAGADSLSFDLTGEMTTENVAAAIELSNLFKSSPEVRSSIVAVSVGDGSVYLELGDADLGFRDHEGALGD